MSELYSDTHRTFQDLHDTRRLADRLEALAHGEFDSNDRAFIQSANFFFLSTVDQKGRPTVSYKGGPAGFVRVTTRPSSFSRSTTATACSYHLATLRARPRWACCSSTSNRHEGCVFKAQRR